MTIEARLLKGLTISWIFIGAACSTPVVTPKAGQRIVYLSGAGAVLEKTKGAFVAVVPIGQVESGRMGFSVVVQNTGKQPFNFGLENIHAVDGTNSPLRLFSREQLEKEARSKAAWSAVAVGLGVAGQAMQASQPTQTFYSGSHSSTTNYSGASNYSVYGAQTGYLGSIQGSNYGTASTYGTSSGVATTYNPAATAAANAAIQANAMNQMTAINANKAASLSAARSVIATTTVFPQRWYEGVLIVKTGKEINITVDAAGESHAASFEVK